MKACSAKRYILILGCFSLVTSIAGYCGLWRIISGDPYSDIKVEAYRIIDAAQVWYIRSAENGGGARSFTRLNFRVLGFSGAKSDSVYIYRDAVFKLENIRKYSFDLVVTAPDGVILECKGLTFDTRPVFRRIPEKEIMKPDRKDDKAV